MAGQRELLDVPSKLKALGVRAFLGDTEASLAGYRVIMLMGYANYGDEETEMTVVVDSNSSAFLDDNITDELMADVRAYVVGRFFAQLPAAVWRDETTGVSKQLLRRAARRERSGR